MNQRERALATVTAALVLGGGLWVLGIEPAYARWTELGARLAEAERKLEAERSTGERAGALARTRKELEVTLWPADETPLEPWFIDHVRELSRAAGLEPDSLRAVGARALDPPGGSSARRGSAGRGEEPASAYAELRFELRFTSSMRELTEFLARLAASDRHVRVSSLALTPGRKGGDDLQANLSLVALVPANAVAVEGVRK